MHLKKIFMCLPRGEERRRSVTSIRKGNEKEFESERYVVTEEKGSQWLQFAAAISGK